MLNNVLTTTTKEERGWYLDWIHSRTYQLWSEINSIGLPLLKAASQSDTLYYSASNPEIVKLHAKRKWRESNRLSSYRETNATRFPVHVINITFFDEGREREKEREREIYQSAVLKVSRLPTRRCLMKGQSLFRSHIHHTIA